MANNNYDLLFHEEIESIIKNPLYKEKQPRLLLHVCCAPCSSAVLERLRGYFDITVYYYNPNIHPETEYTRRLNELKDFLDAIVEKSTTISLEKLKYIVTDYNPEDYFNAVETEKKPERKTERERGERCLSCYSFRLRKTAQYANENGFDYFTTVLSISPHKDAEAINTIGKKLENEFNCSFLYADFKKRNGYKRSLELSAEFELYRQKYCGCVFSQR